MGASSSKSISKIELIRQLETERQKHNKKLREVYSELHNSKKYSDLELQTSKNTVQNIKRQLENSLSEHQHAYNELQSSSSSKISELFSENNDLRKQLSALRTQSKTKTFGRMEFLEADRIGTGSNGTTVFSGKLLDGSDGRFCAIKKIQINKEDRQTDGSIKELTRARKETEIMKQFSHENLIKYYDSSYDEFEGCYYIAMQLCKMTLDVFIVSTQHLEWRSGGGNSLEIVDVLKQITEGIDYLHNRVKSPLSSGFSNIAHRDLKPQNILIGEKNVGRMDWVVVLADFGLSTEITKAKAGNHMPASTTGNHGTVGWRPPTHIDAKLTSKSDIFTLGLLFHYCIAGVLKKQQSAAAKLRNRPQNSWMVTEWVQNIGTTIRLNYSSCLEAQHLVEFMLSNKSSLRPSASQILQHPLFWTGSEKIKFVEEISAKLSLPKRAGLIGELPKDFSVIENKIDDRFETSDWKSSLPNVLMTEVTTPTKTGKHHYDDCTLDLLRLIRNHYHHWNDLHFNEKVKFLYNNHSPQVTNLIDLEADVDDHKYMSYWTQYGMFPSLIITFWAALEPWKNELGLIKYYPEDYNFAKPMRSIDE